MLHIAYIALGSNLGDREQALRSALAAIDGTRTSRVTAVSSFLENTAVGGPADSPAFLNAAAEVVTELNAQDLLQVLLDIEQSLGRFRVEKWGPRTIDLDLILFENQCIETERLKVPHPLMHVRKFVLHPLAEIAGEVTHPKLNKTIVDLLNAL